MKIKILLTVLLLIVFVVGLAGCHALQINSPVKNSSTGDLNMKLVAQDLNMKLVAQHDTIEVYRFSDKFGLFVFYCYVAINTRDMGTNAIISCR